MNRSRLNQKLVSSQSQILTLHFQLETGSLVSISWFAPGLYLSKDSWLPFTTSTALIHDNRIQYPFHLPLVA